MKVDANRNRINRPAHAAGANKGDTMEREGEATNGFVCVHLAIV